ncbi:MAG TPA: hypothetical protein VJL89_13450 [Thermodesulfovibrionia bacterium]|nr:hypothetical protein [Thermodesulfovibrionia bacterium]
MEGQPAEPAKEGTESGSGVQSHVVEHDKEGIDSTTAMQGQPVETGKDEPALRMEGQPSEPALSRS